MNASRVNSVRAVVRWAVRGVAFLMIAGGAYMLVKRLFWAAITGPGMWDQLRAYMSVGEEHSFSRGVAMLVVGTALAMLSARISRWIVTVPSQGCPRCGYATCPERGTRCPECGLKGD